MQQRQTSYNSDARYEVTFSDVEYLRHGDEPLQVRIYKPEGRGPFPVLLNAHGGAWNNLDRTRDESLNLVLAASGILVAAFDFRLAPAHPYPAQIVDVHYGIRWLKAHAHEWGGDAGRTGAVGTSSGGHTVLLIAMRPHDAFYASIPLPGAPDVDARLDYVVLNSAVIDPYVRYTWAKGSGNDRLVAATEAYFPHPEAMHEANPQEMLDRRDWEELPPVLIIHGTADQNYPNEIPERFAPAYQAAGGYVQFEQFPGMPHVFVQQPGPETERAHSVMKRFIAQQLNAGPTPSVPN